MLHRFLLKDLEFVPVLLARTYSPRLINYLCDPYFSRYISTGSVTSEDDTIINKQRGNKEEDGNKGNGFAILRICSRSVKSADY